MGGCASIFVCSSKSTSQVNTLHRKPPSSGSQIPIKKPITSSSSEITSSKPKSLQPDRLSNLPDDILLHILVCLNDTRYAVQTSVLSKRWKHLWTSLEDLNFCSKSFTQQSSFDNFVRAVLTHQRRLNCRVDRFRYYAKLDTTMLTQLTSYALSRGAREFIIAPPSYYETAILPDLSPGSPTLKTLHLKELCIRRSSFGHSMLGLTRLHLESVLATSGSFGGCFDIFNIFPNLTNLSLIWCSLWGENLKITGPKIVSLKLDNVRDVGQLDLSLPNLEVLEYYFFGASKKVNDFSSINLPSLRHADLDVDLRGFPTYGHRLLKPLQGIRNVESLGINLKALKASGLLENQTSPFRNLKSLKLRSGWPWSVPATIMTYFISGTQYSQDMNIDFV
ncbi:hypothetical protein Tsubulata_012668 [Turnera subulata]|uniref:F-box domain-containing protein n=1 Tax=Turnera subulata TaxID=218843 RepID=A0A9Q0JI49_9ROSI|nr:hypothetical protein Tsubulata_012668 [Turnera subulata]